MAERIILSDTFEMTTKIFGPYDENIKVIEDAFKVMDEKPRDLIKPIVYINWN